MKLTGLCANLKPEKCLKLAKQRNLKQFGIFVAICLIFSPLIIYCLIQIINAYSLYRANVDEIENATPDKEMMNNNLFDASNDNADDDNPSGPEEPPLTDEYDLLTKAIQNSFAGYKDYNAKMENFYKDRQLEGKPDKLDETVLNPENDDW